MLKLTNTLKAEYNKRSRRAIDEAESRRRALYLTLPELKRIADERISVSYGMGLKLIEGGDPDEIKASVMSELARLDEAEAELLLSAGVDADYLKPRFSCKLCSDSGYTDELHTKLCTCAMQRIIEERYKASRIDPKNSFEAFDEEIYESEAVRKRRCRLKDFLVEYCAGFPDNPKPNMLFMGEVGVGKTFFLDCIAKRITEKGYTALKLTSYALINEVMKGILKRDVPSFDEPDLLLIDDLGSEPDIPNITAEHIFSVLNERAELGKSTIVATNLDKNRLFTTYGERIASRLFAERSTTVIDLKGSDLRLSKGSRQIPR